MKNLLNLNLLAVLLLSFPAFALDGVAVIDMRTAVLSTQAAADAFKALEEDSDYASNLEEAQSLQAERQSIAEKLQKELETLSQDQIAKMQKDIQDKGKDLEFLSWKDSTSTRRNCSKKYLQKMELNAEDYWRVNSSKTNKSSSSKK